MLTRLSYIFSIYKSTYKTNSKIVLTKFSN